MNKEECEIETSKAIMELRNHIAKLEMENGFTVSAMTEQQLKVALEKGEQLEKENAELKEQNAELTCQMKRNFYCYSCKNAEDRCFKKEIGCPCGKYKSWKEKENENLKRGYHYEAEVINGKPTGKAILVPDSLAYAKSIIQDLLNNSDEYAKQRAREFLEEK